VDPLRAPRVTVVVPTYNRRRLLRAALDSVFAQEFSDFEVIVVDDGSMNATREFLVETYPGESRLRYTFQENQGAAAARNRGLDLARAPWTALLDSDDLYLPGHLASQSAALAADPEARMVVCDARIDGDGGTTRGSLFAHRAWRDPTILENVFYGAWAQPSCVMVHTETARTLRFDPRFTYVEDTEFLLRFLAAGNRCILNRTVASVWRKHPGDGEEPQLFWRPEVGYRFSEMLETYFHLSPDPRHTRYEIDRKRAIYYVHSNRWRLAWPHIWGWFRTKPDSTKAWGYLLRGLISRLRGG